ncbi:MAG: response regulator [candidate division NC10 bacterium]|nr:response regulator [candidate division NC10 bacterium]
MTGLYEEQRPRILVVDDQEENLDLLEAFLEVHDYEVTRARNGQEALAQVAEEPPALILLDTHIPAPDGFQVCRQLKQNEQTRLIPIIIVTAAGELESRIRGIEAGADDFLTKPIHRVELDARVRSLLRLKQFTDELENVEVVLISLALAVEAKDPSIHGHCERLADYAVQLGQRHGLPSEHLTALRRAGYLHDLGKITVPEAILLKAGPLTPEEWKIMRLHPVVGERICQPLRSLRLVLPIIRHHHERWDGSGYPDGLAEEAIPLTARILQIVDVFDALIADRPYRALLSPAEATTIIQEEAGKGWYEPKLLAEFIALINSDGGSLKTGSAALVG